ncbi:MAG TPA: serine hydrolase domain-containing protein [Candidatus Acidoferrum sp.]|jgi:serine beta-lactamase-like protein LACTB
MQKEASKIFVARKFLVVLSFLVAGCVGSAVAPVSNAQAAPTAIAPAKDYSKAEEHARAVAKELLGRGIPGLAVAVAVDGRIVYSEGFGFADLEERVPVWPTTKFRIGSVSKPLTAVALVQLVEQGKLDLDAPIQKYVPSFPDKGAPITTRMLAGHLGGIRHYKDDENLSAKHYSNVLEGLKIFQDDPLVAPPGTKFSYSSYGFNLLSAVVQGASGQDFLSYMHEHVFEPLGLRSTVEDQPAEIIEQRARFYTQPKDKHVLNAPFVDNSYKWAGGGFLSSAEDLVRFGSALLQPGFLKRDSLQLLFTPQKTKDGQETKYGMGWFIGKSTSGQKILEHSGGSVGGTSELILYPDAHMVVAMVTNFASDEGGRWKTVDVQEFAEGFEK